MTVKKFLALFHPGVSDTKHIYHRLTLSGQFVPLPSELVTDPTSDRWKSFSICGMKVSAFLGMKVSSFFVKNSDIYIDIR